MQTRNAGVFKVCTRQPLEDYLRLSRESGSEKALPSDEEVDPLSEDGLQVAVE